MSLAERFNLMMTNILLGAVRASAPTPIALPSVSEPDEQPLESPSAEKTNKTVVAEVERAWQAAADAWDRVKIETEATARVKGIIARARELAAAASAAERAYRSSITSWAEQGAHGTVIGDPALKEVWQQAKAEAKEARLIALGVIPALYQQELEVGRVRMLAGEIEARRMAKRLTSEAIRSVWLILRAEWDEDRRLMCELHQQLEAVRARMAGRVRLCRQSLPFKGESADIVGEFKHCGSLREYSGDGTNPEMMRLMAPELQRGSELLKHFKTRYPGVIVE